MTALPTESSPLLQQQGSGASNVPTVDNAKRSELAISSPDEEKGLCPPPREGDQERNGGQSRPGEIKNVMSNPENTTTSASTSATTKPMTFPSKEESPKKDTNSNNPTTPSSPSWSEVFAEVVPYLRPRDAKHTALALASFLFVLSEKLVNVLPPLAIRHAVDAIAAFAARSGALANVAVKDSDSVLDDDAATQFAQFQQQTARAVTLSIVSYFLLTTLSTALSSLQSITQRSVSLDAERRFSIRLFRQLHDLGPSYHLERHAGELLRVLSRGSDATSTIIDALLFNLIPTLFEACVVGAVFWKLLGIPSIAICTIGAVTLYLIYTLRVTNTRVEQRRKVLQKSDVVGTIETESIVNYETVSIFGRSSKEVMAYDEARTDYMKERVNMLGLFALLQLGQQTIRLLGVCLGLYLAGRATVYGTISSSSSSSNSLTPGSFVIVQLYIQQLFQPLSYLGFTYRQITQAFTDLEKAIVILQSEPLVKDAPDAKDWGDGNVDDHGKISNFENSRNDNNGNLTITTTTSAKTGDIVFDNVSFQYKIKSNRKKLGGPDIQDDNDKGGTVGAGGKGRRRGGGVGGGHQGPGRAKGLWGGRGRGVWSGSGGGNFWMKDVPPTSNNKQNNSKRGITGDQQQQEESSMQAIGGIQNVSLHIPAGHTAALVGPSGSGKTTIVRLVLRMYDPDEGNVLIDDHNVKTFTQQSLRSNIGVVAQDTILFHASLRDNIIYGKEDATDDEIWEAVRISALEPFVQSLPDGLDTLVGERGMKLSGGERQRVGLARCIIKKPRVILLDEATSALDSGTEKVIQRNILTPDAPSLPKSGNDTDCEGGENDHSGNDEENDIQKVQNLVCHGRTTLMIAHRLSTARRANIIFVLDKGKIVERGTHEELLQLGIENGMYAKMWKDQMEGDPLDQLK